MNSAYATKLKSVAGGNENGSLAQPASSSIGSRMKAFDGKDKSTGVAKGKKYGTASSPKSLRKKIDTSAFDGARKSPQTARGVAKIGLSSFEPVKKSRSPKSIKNKVDMNMFEGMLLAGSPSKKTGSGTKKPAKFASIDLDATGGGIGITGSGRRRSPTSVAQTEHPSVIKRVGVKTTGATFKPKPKAPPSPPKKLGTIHSRRAEDKKDEIVHVKPGDDDGDSTPDSWIAAVLARVASNATIAPQAQACVDRIQAAGGLPHVRRLSVRDNDLVVRLTRAMGNDPSVTKLVIDGDERVAHLPPNLLLEFAESLRGNLSLQTLTMRNVELGNGFLSALADSMSTNFTLESLDLSDNCFTNDSLVDFCIAMADTKCLRKVNLKSQRSSIFSHRQDLAIDGLVKNHVVTKFKVEFQSKECAKQLKQILDRNGRENPPVVDYSQQVLQYLQSEAELAEKLRDAKRIDEQVQQIDDSEWPYLHELAELANQYKLHYDTTSDGATESYPVDDKASLPSDSARSMLSQSLKGSMFSADGAFLDNSFISQYCRENVDDGSFIFDFTNQFKLFKRFPSTDPARRSIVKKFVDTLVSHPDARKITHINMANTLCGNDWLAYLSERCRDDQNLLPRLHLLNLETNLISGPGVSAMAECLAMPGSWKYVQAIKLDNQRHLLSSDAENDLARALSVNRSVVKLGLRMRTLLERRRISNYLSRNTDLLRQARRWHGMKTGTLKERARNKMEQLFDRVAANDPTLSEVEVVSDAVFTSMHRDEVMKAAESFASNSHVKKIKMSLLLLDDEFALKLSQSLATNTAVEKVDLETNSFGSAGLIALIGSLSTNRSITEMMLRHQTKPMASSDEEKIIKILKDNDKIVKLGVDLRSMGARSNIDRKLRENQEIRRKAAAPAKAEGAGSRPRNRVQQLLDRIAQDDDKITEVEIVKDPVFLSMNSANVLEAAKCFETNTQVKGLKLSGLQLNDEFAFAFANILERNTTLEKIDLESNAIGTDGIKAIVQALARNSGVRELLLRHQSKSLSSADEEELPGLLQSNETLTKLSIDIRSLGAKGSIEKKLRENQELARRNRQK